MLYARFIQRFIQPKSKPNAAATLAISNPKIRHIYIYINAMLMC